MLKSLLNAISFQLFWFACVLGGDNWAVAAIVVYFVIHHVYFVRTHREWWLILLFVVLGVVIDGALIFDGWLLMPPSIWTFPIPPPWLLGLWAGVGSLFFHCLSWGLDRPWLLSALAAFFAPMSYLVGADFAEVSLGRSTIATWALMAFIWFWVMQVGVFAAKLTQKRNGRKHHV